ncbi:2-oxoglutarate dehydrogenase, E2 component, dihydrolipoamide succinyltransferase [Terracoccus luteus]|uniref:Dihydrolipoamide acetyltransferase component of pyruvate dehydrogenase complex n=1 Tax=Terracoccus luteus TaxID=53356 RepID=A0A839PQ89_9MICO|nr:2-oxoglutarate dehydrogenase, E2 component, dihydrolipoamide succinyltransferase [Terracoccus luteus]MBB2984984.1 2-oxoglutarate dehydrogenase E2 component (dihydrolipoamide succinyltransferase) [Terracoccus luteus]MCP2170636.1 2-oxoglutarate dehydrogenase E2 component (dihydrolipoamide succinyltransferase) [Terracoccus luteus]
MSERVTMPALGESVTEGTVTRWLKNVGDQVEVDEPLLEVSTDKVDTEIPSPVAGTLQEILAQEDDTVPVGADLAVIGDGAAPSGSGSDDAGQDAGQDAGGSAPQEAAASQDAPKDDTPAEAPSTEAEPEVGTSEPETEQASPGPKPTSGGSDTGETVTMPALGESVTEGTVTRWLKSEGDDVEVDEPLLEVSTDKVDTEIPSPVAGKLTRILAQEDETVPVGGELAVIGGSQGGVEPAGNAPDEHVPAQQSPEAPEPAQSAPAPQQEQSSSPAAAQASAGTDAPAQAKPEQATDAATGQSQADAESDGKPPAQPQGSSSDDSSATTSGSATSSSTASSNDSAAYVTPLVRKLATQHGIELSSVTGTGVGGRIRKQDVLDAAEAAKKASAPEPAQPAQPAASAPAPSSPAAPSAPASSGGGAPAAAESPKRGTREKMTRLRKVIAQRMVESLQVSAQLTTVVEVDLTKVARLRARAKSDFESREGVKLSFLPFLALAATEALKAHPNVNASVDGEEIVYHGSENLSIAVDTEKGLIVPVVKNAGDLNIAGLARAIADVAARTRSNKITPDDLAGGTFTITNTGSRGALFDTPIINQPQVAILGTGAIVKRPVVVADADGGETIAVRSMMYLALSYDHRIVDGADAARFLGTMKARLEEGRFEASLGL